MTKVQIAIIIEGGIIQNVLTNDSDVTVEYVIVDYDTDGADAGDITPVLQDDGDFADAYVSKSEASLNKTDTDALFTIADSEGI